MTRTSPSYDRVFSIPMFSAVIVSAFFFGAVPGIVVGGMIGMLFDRLVKALFWRGQDLGDDVFPVGTRFIPPFFSIAALLSLGYGFALLWFVGLSPESWADFAANAPEWLITEFPERIATQSADNLRTFAAHLIKVSLCLTFVAAVLTLVQVARSAGSGWSASGVVFNTFSSDGHNTYRQLLVGRIAVLFISTSLFLVMLYAINNESIYNRNILGPYVVLNADGPSSAVPIIYEYNIIAMAASFPPMFAAALSGFLTTIAWRFYFGPMR